MFDLYCGTGTIGLALARKRGAVWGVEISEEAVACAIENAELNGIENARFFAGNVGQSLEELARRREARTSSSSIPRGRVSRGRRSGGQGRSAPPGSSTSRAIRPRSRRISRCSGTSSATSSSAAGRSTCSRTRRTSSRSPCSAWLRRARACTADIAPEQVGVRDEEAEADRGSAGRPAMSSQDQTRTSVAAREARHPDHVAATRVESGRPRRGTARRRRCRAGRCSRSPYRRVSGTRPRPARRSRAAPRRRTPSGRRRRTRCPPRGRAPRRARPTRAPRRA